MRKSYRRAEVLRQLDARGGTFTTTLPRRGLGWNPGNLRNPIQGPADNITWTMLDDGRVSMNVDRGHHGRIEMGVQHQHTVSPEPVPDRATVKALEGKGKRLLGLLLVIYLAAFVIGAAAGTAVAGRSSYVAILIGGLLGFVGCAVVLRTIVLVVMVRRRTSAAAQHL